MPASRRALRLLSLVVTLALLVPGFAAAAAPASAPPGWYVAGDWNGWNAADPGSGLYDDGSHGDITASDGIHTGQFVFATAGRHEFKVTNGTSSVSHPSSGNSWLDAQADGQTVTITFDTNSHADNWQPATSIIGVSSEPGAWTAVGDWQGWANDAAATAMAHQGDGIYRLVTTVASPGEHEFKAVRTGTWDAVGADGRAVNASTLTFATTVINQQVTFTVDALAGRIRAQVAAAPPVPRPDGDIWWDGLGHNSRSDLYRVPGGAVATGTPVTIRFRTFHNDVTAVTMRVWSTAAGAETLYPMERVATTRAGPYGYDYWQATLPAQAQPTILWYRFIVRDGSRVAHYGDDDLFDGGWGHVYDTSPDYSFQISVYDPTFQTPDWLKSAVVYQIFPDRFFNGVRRNDPRATDPTVYGQPVLVKPWTALPEGYCRSYEGPGLACGEQPLGRDFFGGDLAGIRAKLSYLKDLGVTALYLNPIFMAPSNHLYDPTDYDRIDPYLGTIDDFEKLVQEAGEAGMRIILDGVFDHTSSDSVYFDRYGRYPRQGAYESQSSSFYPWYTFSAWPASYNSRWGLDSLPVLTEMPAVRSFVYGDDQSVARTWIGRGAAGWRLDAAPGRSHGWWQELRTRVKSADPEAVIVGEVWDNASEWLLGDEFDSAMNYRFRRALIGFVLGQDYVDPNQGTIRALSPDQFDSALQSITEDYPAPAHAALMNLVGSHDTQRILWALTPGARNRAEKESPANLGTGKARLRLLSTLQLTLPGAPTIYYGDEVGLTGDTDPDDRRPFPWASVDEVLLAHYQALIRLRNQHSFLRTGSFDRLYTHNDDGTYAYGRKDATGAAVVAVNRSSAGRGLNFDLSGYIPEGTVLSDALGGSSYTVAGGRISVTLPGPGAVVLVTPPGVDLTPPGPPGALEAVEGDSSVRLSWSAAPGAAGYHVYRSVVAGGGYTRLTAAPIASASYADETAVNGTTYYYVVTAVDGAGNESGRSNEARAVPHLVIGWASLQGPTSIAHTMSALVATPDVYGQAWIDGCTSQPGPAAGLRAQAGYGPAGSPPAGNSAWVWVEARFNVDAGNNDELKARFLPEAAGTFDYGYRYSTDGGRNWLYADLAGPRGDGTSALAQPGMLIVSPSADTTPPATPANLHVSRAAAGSVALAWDEVTDAGGLFRYDVYRAGASGGPYTLIGSATGPAYTDGTVAAGSTCYYVVQAVDTSWNRSGYSREVQATANPRTVHVTFNVTVPEGTDGVAASVTVYLASNFPDNSWNPAGQALARVDATHWSATIDLPEGRELQYKYTLGSWDHVEKGASCEELGNRSAIIAYGASGTMTLDDTVLNWRNVPPCGD